MRLCFVVLLLAGEQRARRRVIGSKPSLASLMCSSRQNACTLSTLLSRSSISRGSTSQSFSSIIIGFPKCEQAWRSRSYHKAKDEHIVYWPRRDAGHTNCNHHYLLQILLSWLFNRLCSADLWSPIDCDMAIPDNHRWVDTTVDWRDTVMVVMMVIGGGGDDGGGGDVAVMMVVGDGGDGDGGCGDGGGGGGVLGRRARG